MFHTILVIPQEYINVTEIETYSLRGILEWGKLFYTMFQTLCVLNSYFQFIKKHYAKETSSLQNITLKLHFSISKSEL